MADHYTELEHLKKLLDEDVLTQEEFDAQKARVLEFAGKPGYFTPKSGQVWGLEENTYCMLLHLSQLLGLLPVMPVLGLVAPLVLWVTNKDKSDIVDTHGRHVVNWLISLLIYLAVAGLLCFLLIGIPIFVGLLGLGIVFSIIGAVKAANGEVWQYPLTIHFIKEPEPAPESAWVDPLAEAPEAPEPAETSEPTEPTEPAEPTEPDSETQTPKEIPLSGDESESEEPTPSSEDPARKAE